MQESIDNESPITPQEESFYHTVTTYESLMSRGANILALASLEDAKSKAVARQDYQLAADIRDMVLRHKA